MILEILTPFKLFCKTLSKTFEASLKKKRHTERHLKRSYCRTVVRSLDSRNSNGPCLKTFFENHPDVLKSVYSIGNYDPELGSLFHSMYRMYIFFCKHGSSHTRSWR